MNLFSGPAFLGQVRLRGYHFGAITTTEGSFAGGLSSTAKAAAEGAYTAAKQFQDAVNSNVPGAGKSEELAKYERDFNESFDTLIREGGVDAALNAYNDFKARGISTPVLVDLRDKLYVNKYTGLDLRTPTTTPGATGGKTTQPTTTQTPKQTTQPAKPVASTDQPHLPPPGGPHSYEEEYQQYQYQQDAFAKYQKEQAEAEKARYEAEKKAASTQDEALRRHQEWMKQAGISQEYAPVATQNVRTTEQRPTEENAMCPVGSFVDPVTRQCRGSVATGGRGGLINQALTLPGATAASGISLMGRRYPVVNL